MAFVQSELLTPELQTLCLILLLPHDVPPQPRNAFHILPFQVFEFYSLLPVLPSELRSRAKETLARA